MHVGVLGPLELHGEAAGLSPRDRTVLYALVTRRRRVVTADQLADALWGDQPPASAAKNLQGCIARLRKRLGASLIETVGQGYRLTLADDASTSAGSSGPSSGAGSSSRSASTTVLPRWSRTP
jgi:DNA-binding SARP family transcriptional activator